MYRNDTLASGIALQSYDVGQYIENRIDFLSMMVELKFALCRVRVRNLLLSNMDHHRLEQSDDALVSNVFHHDDSKCSLLLGMDL